MIHEWSCEDSGKLNASVGKWITTGKELSLSLTGGYKIIPGSFDDAISTELEKEILSCVECHVIAISWSHALCVRIRPLSAVFVGAVLKVLPASSWSVLLPFLPSSPLNGHRSCTPAAACLSFYAFFQRSPTQTLWKLLSSLNSLPTFLF